MNKTVQELELFQSEWSEYLKQANISNEVILKAKFKAENLNKKAKLEELYFKSLFVYLMAY